jgi:general secretion pathway protein L
MKALLNTPLKRLTALATELGRHRHVIRACGWVRAWIDELIDLLRVSMRRRMVARASLRRILWPLPLPLPLQGACASATLVLPYSEVMAQTINLPVAAAADLMRVMSFEIDRYTPFSADQVHFATRVTQRTADRVSVRLVVVDRERLMQIIEDCREAGLILQAIDALDAHDDAMGVDLLPSSLRPAPSRTAHTRRVLLLTCAALTVALMLSLLDRRQTQVERMSQAVAQQRQQMTGLEASRRELTDTQGASGYLARLKTSRPTLTVLLTELSHCLGDDTWLEQLEVRESGDVSMSGQSPQASALINRVRDCHSLQNARFQGVIQPDPQSGKDRFSLAAQLRQEASDAPSR